MDRFLLAHLSDPHLTPPALAWRWTDTLSKRGSSRLSWQRKRRHVHRPEVLAVLTSDIAAQAPDHVVVTGDLTNFSMPEEFAAAAVWLETLGRARDVTVSPGNHDVLVERGADERLAAWRPWLGDEGTAFPYLRRRGPVALINLCSGTPTPVFSAQGALGRPQRARLADLLEDCRQEGLARVVVLHHPPTDGVVAERKALIDRRALLDVLGRHGAELVLHGHAHRPATSTVPGPNGAIPVLCVPSASAADDGRHSPARWHAIEVEGSGEAARFRIAARGQQPGAAGVVELGRYTLA